MMSSLISDVIDGSVSPQVTNAACNAGGKMLKVVELQLKYGKPGANGTRDELQLAPAPQSDTGATIEVAEKPAKRKAMK